MKEDLFNQLSNTSEEVDMPAGHRQRFAAKLNSNLHLENKLWSLQRYLSVASVVIFLGISLLVLISIGDFHSTREFFSGASAELSETEMFLRAEIDNKLDQIASHDNIDKQLITDILKTDGSLKQIQADLEKNPGDDRLVSAILDSYQVKLELLDQIISQLEYYDN